MLSTTWEEQKEQDDGVVLSIANPLIRRLSEMEDPSPPPNHVSYNSVCVCWWDLIQHKLPEYEWSFVVEGSTSGGDWGRQYGELSTCLGYTLERITCARCMRLGRSFMERCVMGFDSMKGVAFVILVT